ncbi:tRNA A64-2'-O-ribosylphosphate transferase [Polychytrium aggregatum]|uniref:tRNA A64-2'-O-ribosylphosphate transferase n=1 Tax=Polychytrium aggregatum TaxID=110093 RepID=UPI0022FDC2CA|nr:tRNA A64-2'-O-ribosylphosphate transferase [Polychytrium aggregatum]KAI9209581.1 tRNA A64-2'-O-ribosylphosphate transferase [Polychytrium aggregatum]
MDSHKAQREAIRRESRSLFNRLKSIIEDAQFVTEVADSLSQFPLVANERCGSWYIDPERRADQSVYFKSTDGHFGKWDFNMKRLNWHILKLVGSSGGCVIVDSTRNGKRIPDSLSKTVPIWCCVINSAIERHRLMALPAPLENATQEAGVEWDTQFHSLPSVVSRSEHAQIQERIPMFVERLMSSSVNMALASALLAKPLRPIWITHQTDLLHLKSIWSDYNSRSDDSFPYLPIFLVTASQAVPDGQGDREGYTYVQGSADDHEMWGQGLTVPLFWSNIERIAAIADQDECESTVREIVAAAKQVLREDDAATIGAGNLFDWIGDTGIAIGRVRSGRSPGCWEHFDVVVNCGAAEDPDNAGRPNYFYLPIPEGKKGQHDLGAQIPHILRIMAECYSKSRPRVLFHCAQGKDRSVGIALATLLQFYNNGDRSLVLNDPLTTKPRINKNDIQNALLFVQSFRPVARPSRATIKQLTTYFMSSK